MSQFETEFNLRLSTGAGKGIGSMPIKCPWQGWMEKRQSLSFQQSLLYFCLN